tara:strand:+ start:849 stop:1094 length:246 start_codon:yes stop_codon:yes gene_type:complete
LSLTRSRISVTKTIHFSQKLDIKEIFYLFVGQFEIDTSKLLVQDLRLPKPLILPDRRKMQRKPLTYKIKVTSVIVRRLEIL